MARYTIYPVLAIGTSVGTSAPVVVFNSFGPSDTYIPVGVAVGCGADCWHDEGHTSAWSFIPAQTVQLSIVETAAWQIFGTAANLVLGITSDDLGLPGATLESFSSLVSTPALLAFTSIDHPLPQAGQHYWFTAATLDLVKSSP